jgi:hypothetical protein
MEEKVENRGDIFAVYPHKIFQTLTFAKNMLFKTCKSEAFKRKNQIRKLQK